MTATAGAKGKSRLLPPTRFPRCWKGDRVDTGAAVASLLIELNYSTLLGATRFQFGCLRTINSYLCLQFSETTAHPHTLLPLALASVANVFVVGGQRVFKAPPWGWEGGTIRAKAIPTNMFPGVHWKLENNLQTYAYAFKMARENREKGWKGSPPRAKLFLKSGRKMC